MNITNTGIIASSMNSQTLLSNSDLYINAISDFGGTITEPNKTKVRTLFTDLENAGIYNKIKILYLYHGNTPDSGGLNAVNPSNILGSYKITWTGSPLFNANGGLLSNAGVRGNTGFLPDGGGLDFLTGAGMGFWADETVNATEYTMGIYPLFWFSPSQGYVALSNGFTGYAPTQNGVGLHFATRESESNSVKTYYGDTLASTTGPAFNIVFNGNGLPAYIGGMIELPNTFYSSLTDIRLSVFTVGLNASEVTALNTCFQTYLS